MHRSRKSIATVAIALAGVLAMAGVAAAHGGTNSSQHTRGHRQRGHTTTSTSTSTPGAVTTTTKVEHAKPEPGDDNGVDAVGHDANEHVAAAAIARSHAATANDNGVDAVGHDANDDNGVDAVGNDANDDNGVDATTTTVVGTTTTTSLPDETTTTVATIPNGMQTFTVTGGTVSVDIENGVLTLVSATPSAGFVVDKSESRSDRVEVEFRGGDQQSRVRVRIEGGRLRVETGDH